MGESFDLFGEPVPEGWGRRGRPAHVATSEKRNKVMMLLAFGWSNERIAKALDITAPTLRKNYFRELKMRDDARDRMDSTLAMRLWSAAMDGNVAAMKEFRKVTERNDIMAGQNEFYAGQRPKAEKPPKLGKKEMAAKDAETAGINTGWGNDLSVN